MPMTPLPDLSPDALSDVLIGARKSYGFFPEFPAKLPSTLEASYDVQDISRAKWDDVVIGWKVGGVPGPYQERFNATRLTGPVFSRNVYPLASGEQVDMPIYAKGFAAIEPEFMIKLKDCAALPASGLTLEHIQSVIDTIHIGIEVASSPLYDINGIGPVAAICDFGNNWGLVLGPELNNWRETDLTKIEVICEIDGKERGRGFAGPDLDGPLGSVKFLIEHQKARGYNLPVGTFVCSGAVSGVHEMDAGSQTKVTFAGLGELNVSFVDPLN